MRKLLFAPFIAAYRLVYGIGYIPTMVALTLLLGALSLGFMIGSLYLMILGPIELVGYMLDTVIPQSWPWLAAIPTALTVGALAFIIGFGIFLGISRAVLSMIEWVSELEDSEMLETAKDKDFESPREVWRGL